MSARTTLIVDSAWTTKDGEHIALCRSKEKRWKVIQTVKLMAEGDALHAEHFAHARQSQGSDPRP